MIDLEFLESLIRAIDESSIDSVEIERGGTRIRVSKSPSGPAANAGSDPAGGTVVQSAGAGGQPAAPAGAPVAGGAAAPSASGEGGEPAAADAVEAEDTGDDRIDVTSPMVGTFYRAPAPDAPPYVEVGDRVAKGETLCIIEAMKLMNELESEVAGTVAEICVENAEPVEYGQALFRIEPT